MSEKLAASIDSTCDEFDELLNPFVHHLELVGTAEKIKTALLTIVLLPIRVAVICFFLVAGWLLAVIGLWGMTDEELQTKPITGWRSFLRYMTSFFIMGIFYAAGFKLKVKGKRANRSEASVVALAPHSSFVDSIAMVYMAGPSIVAKGETASIPFFGKLINFTQPVYVWRDDPNSRQNTIKEIISRAKSELDWPQILIFPEGTCTNRSCLITFKPGAFYPGVPVQPVCIRYPNKLDTVTWTWEGPSALTLLWLTLTQVYSSCEIEFLPVYHPNEEEKRDPKLFATNVRAVMAKALGVPVLDYTYDDCKLITRAKEMNLPNANTLLEVQKVRHRLRLVDNATEEKLVELQLNCRDCSKVNLNQFANYLNISADDPSLQQLFRMYDKNSSGVIDFREYLLGVLGLNTRTTMDTIKLAFKIYDRTGSGKLPVEDFTKVLWHTLALNYSDSLRIFRQVDSNNSEHVAFEPFKTYMAHRPEFAHIFAVDKDDKPKVLNGEICPNDYKKHD